MGLTFPGRLRTAPAAKGAHVPRRLRTATRPRPPRAPLTRIIFICGRLG